VPAPVVLKINIESSNEVEMQFNIQYSKKSASERDFLDKEENEFVKEDVAEPASHRSSALGISSDQVETSESNVAGHGFRVIEAKETFEDNESAQLAAQMYDLLNTLDVCVVHGILCTGTKWLFFTMARDDVSSSSSSSQKRTATMKCVGVAGLHIIEDDFPAQAAEGGPQQRRQSAANKGTIAESEVRMILELFAAFLSKQPRK
jgi:hypothetical protein